MESEEVQHDREGRRFFLKLGSEEAYLSYSEKDSVLDFYYVFTPISHRGRGVAATVLVSAFDYASEHGYRVIPSCPYVRFGFLPRFPEYHELILSH